jgi:hypothetical protein
LVVIRTFREVLEAARAAAGGVRRREVPRTSQAVDFGGFDEH